jgi:hypothetical protein
MCPYSTFQFWFNVIRESAKLIDKFEQRRLVCLDFTRLYCDVLLLHIELLNHLRPHVPRIEHGPCVAGRQATIGEWYVFVVDVYDVEVHGISSGATMAGAMGGTGGAAGGTGGDAGGRCISMIIDSVIFTNGRLTVNASGVVTRIW